MAMDTWTWWLPTTFQTEHTCLTPMEPASSRCRQAGRALTMAARSTCFCGPGPQQEQSQPCTFGRCREFWMTKQITVGQMPLQHVILMVTCGPNSTLQMISDPTSCSTIVRPQAT